MADAHATHDHHDHPTGWRRYVYATNHKDIGTMYLIFSLTMFFIGGSMALVIRSELMSPGLQFVHRGHLIEKFWLYKLQTGLEQLGTNNQSHCTAN